jgi:hypothetical protein
MPKQNKPSSRTHSRTNSHSESHTTKGSPQQKKTLPSAEGSLEDTEMTSQQQNKNENRLESVAPTSAQINMQQANNVRDALLAGLGSALGTANQTLTTVTKTQEIVAQQTEKLEKIHGEHTEMEGDTDHSKKMTQSFIRKVYEDKLMMSCIILVVLASCAAIAVAIYYQRKKDGDTNTGLPFFNNRNTTALPNTTSAHAYQAM